MDLTRAKELLRADVDGHTIERTLQIEAINALLQAVYDLESQIDSVDIESIMIEHYQRN